MSFTQLKRIKEIDDTPEKAIESYRSFVVFMNKLMKRIDKSPRKDWTPDRIKYNNGLKAIPQFHEAISEKFGMEVLSKALSTHKFDHQLDLVS